MGVGPVGPDVDWHDEDNGQTLLESRRIEGYTPIASLPRCVVPRLVTIRIAWFEQCYSPVLWLGRLNILHETDSKPVA